MKKPCLQCGVPSNTSTCPACFEKLPTRPRNESALKPSASQRGYDGQWRKVARAVLERDRWACQICGVQLVGKNATVDHMIPLSIAPHLRLDMTNLRAACRSCNSRRARRP